MQYISKKAIKLSEYYNTLHLHNKSGQDTVAQHMPYISCIWEGDV